MVGLATSLYYLGLVIGALSIDRYIRKHGYIRTFISFTILLALATEIYDLTTNMYIWMILRVVVGFSLAASFVVAQSWMMSASTPETRGTSLAIYNIALFGAVTFGQYLFRFTDTDSRIPFVYIAALITASVLPLSLSKASIHESKNPTSLSIIELFKISRTAKITVTMAGVLQAVLYGFLPIYCLLRNYTNAELSFLMTSIVLGGMLLQYPLGKLSDQIDRSKLVRYMFAALIGISVAIIILPGNIYLLFSLLFFYGGLVFAIYPIALNILGDKVKESALASINQGVLFSNSLGAIIGPLLAAWPIEYFGYSGLFIFSIAICLLTLGVDYLLRTERDI